MFSFHCFRGVMIRDGLSYIKDLYLAANFHCQNSSIFMVLSVARISNNWEDEYVLSPEGEV